MAIQRRHTRTISIGNRAIGSDHPILIQSMTNTPTSDFEATLAQIRALENAGCDLVRFTVPDRDAVRNIARLKENTSIPLVADIHFNYRLAIEAAEAGIDKIRINPGNIGEIENVRAVARVCREKKIPIRIGVNSGSVEKELLQQFGGPTPEALCQSALNEIAVLESCDFDNIVISVKSSNVSDMIAANRLLAAACDYPIHLGVTEAGTFHAGLVKSSIGIGSLLADGIGDTLRVSLTTRDLTDEVNTARRILDALHLSEHSIEIVSCPTCGRCAIDLVGVAQKLEEEISALHSHPKKSLKIAVMGCIVNGPGEAREADFGIAGGKGEAIFFRHGDIVSKIPENQIIPVLLEEIRRTMEN